MSTPYGMPAGPPQRPPAPAQKNRTGLYVGIACGCLLLVTLLIAVVGAGLWLFSSGDTTADPTDDPTTSDSRSEDPHSDDPEEDPTSDAPIETPSEDPDDDPTSETGGDQGSSFTIHVSAPEEGTTLETNDDEVLETQKGKFVGVAVTLTNNGSQDIGLSGENFRFYDADGGQHTMRYASFSTTGPQVTPGEEATALLYADVPEDTELASVSYTDDVGTGGQEMTFPVG